MRRETTEGRKNERPVQGYEIQGSTWDNVVATVTYNCGSLVIASIVKDAANKRITKQVILLFYMNVNI